MKSSELIRRVEKAGWYEIRQTGSHKIYKHKDFDFSIPIPAHGAKEVPTGLASKILKQAGLK